MPTGNQRRRPSLTAEFGTHGDARAAMKALENHGIDGLEITVLEGAAEDDRRPADRRELVFISGRVGKGISLGAVAGAVVLGTVGVIAAIAGAPAAAIAAFVLLGAGLGAAVGAFWGVERGVGMSEDWEKTFQEPAGATKPMRIGVYTNADSDTARVRRVLEDHRPLDIRDQTTGSVTR
ncbi:MAG: hypothetical protein ACJ73V_09945 [Acidimicrobiia bacterium]